jgi:hypothetical protein
MVTLGGRQRFYGRSPAGKYPLDVGGIRHGFLAGETGRERIRRFRLERIARIVAQDTPIPMTDGPKLIFHALPLLPDEGVWSRLLPLQDHDILPYIQPIGEAADAHHFNLDGYLTRTHDRREGRNSYTQLFRDGGVEAVSTGFIRIYRSEMAGADGFSGVVIERYLIRALTNLQKLWSKIGLAPPVVLGMAMSGIRGHMIYPRSPGWLPEATFDRDPLVVPEVIVEELARAADTILHPLINLLWNAGGWQASPQYREGHWSDR